MYSKSENQNGVPSLGYEFCIQTNMRYQQMQILSKNTFIIYPECPHRISLGCTVLAVVF